MRIAAEKARLVKAGEIKKFPAPLIVESDDEPGSKLPTGLAMDEASVIF